jgi:hypothetical protein
MRRWIYTTGITLSLTVFGVIGTAAALPIGLLPAAIPTNAENVQFFFGGRDDCWYDYGWRGPGFYWCGYAWRRGIGWGGGRGWHGWRGGGHRDGHIGIGRGERGGVSIHGSGPRMGGGAVGISGGRASGGAHMGGGRGGGPGAGAGGGHRGGGGGHHH